MCAPGGSILQCSDKSKFKHSLGNFGKTDKVYDNAQSMEQDDDTATPPGPSTSRRIAIVDEMVLIRKMTKKPATIITVKDLGQYYNDRLMISPQI